MKVIFSIVGSDTPYGNVEVDMISMPREGETVGLPGLPANLTHVRTVVWYPVGSEEEDEPDPFVYIVLGPRRPD